MKNDFSDILRDVLSISVFFIIGEIVTNYIDLIGIGTKMENHYAYSVQCFLILKLLY